jgi:ADP-heptose:LPS heptosyltransferase
MSGNEARARLGTLAPRRVAILRALQLGDLLCAVPALRAFRAAWPGAEIVLIGLPWAREFVGRFHHLLDGFREFPGYPGLPERPVDVPGVLAFLAAMQADGFDLAIQLHGSGPFVNDLVALLGARRAAGFVLPGGYCPDPEFFRPWPEHGLEIHRLLALVEFLGLPAQGEHLEFPLDHADWQALHAIEGTRGLDQADYVCVHPGASVPERCWPAERFAAVARALARDGVRIVVTGSAGEADLTHRVAELAGVPCLDLAGRTGLGVLGALLSRSRLLVCNDTGVAHIAAALHVPSAIVSTGNNPERWAPLDRERHRVLCSPDGVTPEDVLEQAGTLLRPSVTRTFHVHSQQDSLHRARPGVPQ